MTAPRLATERSATRRTKADPGRPELGESAATLALKKTGFGPCKQDPSNTIFSSRTRVLERGKRGPACSGEKLVCRTELKTLNDRLTKEAVFMDSRIRMPVLYKVFKSNYHI